MWTMNEEMDRILMSVVAKGTRTLIYEIVISAYGNVMHSAPFSCELGELRHNYCKLEKKYLADFQI